MTQPAAPPPLLDILNKAAEYFKSKGVESHRLDAQLLLGHVLGMKRLDLYMNFDRPMEEEELARYRDLVRRRGNREPLQHLVGETPFREITLKTDRRALIPRQETELIVDLVRKRWRPAGRTRSWTWAWDRPHLPVHPQGVAGLPRLRRRCLGGCHRPDPGKRRRQRPCRDRLFQTTSSRPCRPISVSMPSSPTRPMWESGKSPPCNRKSAIMTPAKP